MALLNDGRGNTLAERKARRAIEKAERLAALEELGRQPQCVTLENHNLPGGAHLAVVEVSGKPFYSSLHKKVIQRNYRLVIVTSSTGHVSVTKLGIA